MSLNIQETTYTAGWKIGVDEVGRDVRETSIAGLLYEGKMIDWKKLNEAVEDKQEIAVEWHLDGEDVEILQISNNTTGEVYREYNDLPENRGWTEGDELVVCSLLMYGDLG